MRTDALTARWDGLLGRLTRDDPTATGRELIDRWAEPHRRYHDLAHLTAVLDAVHDLAGHAEDLDAVRLAVWYHDAVYAGAPDDEENSARLAEADLTGLALPPALVAETARLVRLTATHDPAPGDSNGETLCDADLAILAAGRADYARYVEAVRAEYPHVTDETFRAGRATVLGNLLALPTLFRTPAGQQRWESAARANVAAELASLTA
ncbi:metal-dependent phosphohydrolase [Lentzea sp.]|uniref:HD domain-containing protein n=1 Tax=Lentzea sp. TaxID=56099 RepID=UPI002BB1C619|nr:metal-dependent phosphohydrolase [Lentzea sp.]HUQ60549.1 metal-dependent phosphohydrolase [Lentzea sp.]